MNKAVIGVDLGGTNVRAGKVKDETLVTHTRRSISSDKAETVVLQEIADAIEDVFDGDAVGIGVGVPSVVDVGKGIVYAVENIPSWREVHLKSELEKRFNVPVFVNNDANCFALGEFYFGKAKVEGLRDLVALTIGTGLGTGVIINGKLYCGHNCGAGEQGHVAYLDKTIEDYCSGQFFLHRHNTDGAAVYAAAAENDSNALALWGEFGGHVGQAVMNIMYTFDPQMIVFGGSVSRAYRFFEKTMMEKLKEFNYQHAVKRLLIERTESPDIPILGAAALIFDAAVDE